MLYNARVCVVLMTHYVRKVGSHYTINIGSKQSITYICNMRYRIKETEKDLDLVEGTMFQNILNANKIYLDDKGNIERVETCLEVYYDRDDKKRSKGTISPQFGIDEIEVIPSISIDFYDIPIALLNSFYEVSNNDDRCNGTIKIYFDSSYDGGYEIVLSKLKGELSYLSDGDKGTPELQEIQFNERSFSEIEVYPSDVDSITLKRTDIVAEAVEYDIKLDVLTIIIL